MITYERKKEKIVLCLNGVYFALTPPDVMDLEECLEDIKEEFLEITKDEHGLRYEFKENER